MKYDAFISYKHAPLDLEVAKKVHKTLENYHIPKAVQKRTGMKRINRVFRDQEELMVGSDLDGKIEEALKNSVYLIVICSPRTPESIWVQKEIDSFIKLHGRERILAILIEGEPNESFPKALLTDDNGKPVEPLAADIRGRDKKERDGKFKIEFLRLAAALIGCSFDDLKQRHREHKIRQTMFMIAGAAAVLVTFGAIFSVYNAVTAKRMKALAEERKTLMEETERLADDYKKQLLATQINQSKFYARESSDLLNNGNREDAVLVAAEGLPSASKPRPFVSEAEYALSNALFAYSDGSYWDFDRILPHSATVNKKNINPDETRLATLDTTNTVRVFDTSSWECLFEFYPGSSHDASVNAMAGGEKCAYIGCGKKLNCYDFESNLLYEKDYSDRIVSIIADENADRIFVNTASGLSVLEASTGKELMSYDAEGEPGSYLGENTVYDALLNLWLIPQNRPNEGGTYYLLVHTDTCEVSKVGVTGDDIYRMTVSTNGTIVTISGNMVLSGKEIKSVTVDAFTRDGKKKWSRNLDIDIVDLMSFSVTLKANSFTYGGNTSNEIIAIVEYLSFSLNEEDGSVVRSITLPGSARGIFFDENTSVGNVLIMGGSLVPVDFDSGAIYDGRDFNIGNSSASLTAAGKFLILQTYSSDLIIITDHVGKNYNVAAYNATPGTGLGTAPGDKYFVQQSSYSYKQFNFYTMDGKEIYTTTADIPGVPSFSFRDEFFYILKPSVCYEINPLNATTKEISPDSYGVLYGTQSGISNNGKYLVFLNYSGSFAVIDLEDDSKKALLKGELSKEYFSATESLGKNFDRILISDDGNTLYLFASDSPLIKADLQTGEVKELKTEKYLKGDSYAIPTAMSDDGNYIAFSCEKSVVTVFDTKKEEPYVLISSSRIPEYMKFVNGDSTLLIQGEDTTIHFYDIASKEFINYFRPGDSVTAVTEDLKDGLLAVCTGSDMYLFNEEDFGVLACVNHGTAFFTESNLFFLGGSKTFGTIPYKNYKILLDEAKEAFPFSALSDEKKVKYNIT
ncbi:MAG: TIR domain-containing protein [Lachnospiraceae bacterium]|nr:TIR domain-containing protein [Lachnospiraceae bacterium]